MLAQDRDDGDMHCTCGSGDTSRVDSKCVFHTFSYRAKKHTPILFSVVVAVFHIPAYGAEGF